MRGVNETEFKPFANAKRAEDGLLTKMVLDSEEKEYQIFNDKSYDQFNDVHAEFYTGYYLTFSNASADELIELVNQRYVFEMEKVSDQTLTVLNKTDRFAVMESTGGSYKITTTKDNDTSTQTQASDGLYFLKKMPDNSWKIYAYYTNE